VQSMQSQTLLSPSVFIYHRTHFIQSFVDSHHTIFHHDFTTTSFLTIFFSFPPSFPSFRATRIYSSTFCMILHYTTYIIAIINSTCVFASGMLKMFPRLCVPNVPGEMGGLNARKTIDERISSLRTLCLW